MEVSGYAVRFCEASGCDHTDPEFCSNPKGTKYYLDPLTSNLNQIKGIRLVVAHDDAYVVGTCIEEIRDPSRGIYIRCEVDDAYLVEAMKRRFDIYKGKYNKNLKSFEIYWKKVLSSFSLAHRPGDGVVKHVSLVDSPGRLGSAVTYSDKRGKILLKRRPENVHVSDVVASHTTSAAYVPDRLSYLLKNTLKSHSPKDLLYLTAGRDTHKMPRKQELFDITLLKTAVDRALSERKRKRRSDSPSDDSGDEEDYYSRNSSKRSRRTVEASRERDEQHQTAIATPSAESHTLEILKAMKEEMDQIREAVIKNSTHDQPKLVETTANPVAIPPPTEPVTVEASRPVAHQHQATISIPLVGTRADDLTNWVMRGL